MDTVTLPKLGQTMENAIIEKWHVSEGDAVNKGDVLLEITTDKATLEVESYVAGTIRKIVAQEGEEKDVGTLIAVMGAPDEDMPDIDALIKETDAAAAAAAAADKKEDAAPAPSASKGKPDKKDRVRATPRAKKLAKQMGVDLAGITGTGPGGRITEEDIQGGAGGSAPVAAPASVAGVTKQKLSAMRRVIADNMTKSSQEAPHFYLTVEIDMTDAVALREKLKADTGVSYNDMIIKASAVAMSEMVELNATWLGDSVGIRDSIGIGLAVSLDDGLIVPVVRDAQGMTLADIAGKTKDLIARARSKKLTSDEYGNGSITISNLGMLGIDNFMPVINLGESMIMGVGRIQDRAVIIDGQVAARKMNTVTIACDHRVVDGAACGKFLGRVKELLETPDKL
jgi:pyruvate dehydrogenase E2 component (dihydrolipoamide acetyltransferase)